MNLFFKRLFGKLERTKKYEHREERLLAEYKRYCDVATSEELKEYTQLFRFVSSATFQDKKRTLTNRQYKDTQTYRDERKFKKLDGSIKVRRYYKIKDSDELKEFQTFRHSADYIKLGDKKQWKKDERLRRFKLFEASLAYKNYDRLNNSYIIKEYESLKAKVNTPEFQKEKEWWSDKFRWQKTEDYKQECRFKELQKNPEIDFYLHTNPKKFKSLGDWKVTFEEKFQTESLSSQWQQGYFHRAQSLQNIYTVEGQKQAYTNGQNVVVGNDDYLTINTIQEQVEKGLTWNPAKGFYEKGYLYTSGIINTGASFQQRYGKIEAKVRIVNKTDVQHALTLTADGQVPSIYVYGFNGKHITLALADREEYGAKRVRIERETIKGINPKKFFVYTVEWTPNYIQWQVNNIVVKRIDGSTPNKALFLQACSFIGANNAGGSASLVIDWIRCYAHK